SSIPLRDWHIRFAQAMFLMLSIIGDRSTLRRNEGRAGGNSLGDESGSSQFGRDHFLAVAAMRKLGLLCVASSSNQVLVLVPERYGGICERLSDCALGVSV